MGILNVTPDSFSDGGQYLNLEAAEVRALEMIKQGAEIIDIGGESSGPGSIDVDVEEEVRRVVPVIEMLRKTIPKTIIISVDTYKAAVARQAIEFGANMINDITALRGDPKMAELVAQTGVPIVLMYSKDPTARTTREEVHYDDVVVTIKDFLRERIAYAQAHGIKRRQIIIDPGMGAFVSAVPEYSWEILERLHEFKEFDLPILVGASRKSFLGGALNERLGPTLQAHMLAIKNGADIIRVHDVKDHRVVMEQLSY